MSVFDKFASEPGPGVAAPMQAPAPVAEPAAPPQALPIVGSASQQLQTGGIHPFWVGLMAFIAATFLGLWVSTLSLFPGPGPGPRPGPDIGPVDGAYVAIFYDDAAKHTYTKDQIAAIDSAAVAEFLDTKVTGWKKIDAVPMQDLSGLAPVYTAMADEHRAKLPWAVVYAGKRKGSEPVVSADELMKLVERTIK